MPELAAWLQSTAASGDLKITADLAGVKGTPSVRFSGRTTLENFAAADPSGAGLPWAGNGSTSSRGRR